MVEYWNRVELDTDWESIIRNSECFFNAEMTCHKVFFSFLLFASILFECFVFMPYGYCSFIQNTASYVKTDILLSWWIIYEKNY